MSREVDADAFCREAERLGLLGASLAERARAAHRDADLPMPFDEFLVEQGLLSPEQRLAILADDPTDPGEPRVKAADDPGPQPGERHSGCVIEAKLGEGGMGTVFLARREADGERVVLKFLTPQLASNESLLRRFQREGNILARLAPNPHLVRVHAVVDAGVRSHIVMEFVEGKALDTRLREEFSLPPLEAARIARDVAVGLAEIHRAGIIHRDVKPSNVLLGRDGAAKIIDFGLAKDLRADDGISKPGVRLGTPYYMAPEQWGNHVVDARCDLFALGATLYTLVVGEPPFLGSDASQVARRSLRGEYTPPENVARDTPPELSLVIAQLLQVERAHRYADAERVARDLQRVLAGQEILVPRLLERRGDAARRHPLVPGSTFSVGRSDQCRIQLRHPSVSGDHAFLRREPHGYVLADQGSTYGTFVNDAPIAREVALRHGDVVRMGKVVLEFRDEAAATGPARPKSHVSKHPELEHAVCEPVVDALAESGDLRVALHLIDVVAAARAGDPELDEERAALRELVGDDLLERALQAVQARRGERRAWAAARLREMTDRDHGTDAAGWLAWWDEVRGELPPQVVVREPRPAWGVEVQQGLPGNPTVWLPGDAVISVGREEGCSLRLTHQSVSRLHATLFRFPRRLVLRDEGSRFGTLVNGARATLAMLGAGDRIEVGSVTLTLLRRDPGPVRSTLNTRLIDARWFDALEALAHPAVTLGLARFLHQAVRLDWVEAELAPLFPAGAPLRLVERVARAYRERADRARAQLERALDLPPGQGAAGWRQALAERRANLPLQVMPAGWFPDGPEPSPSTATRVAV
ncbi:MAG: protein kinase [Planctomycetes bacterium]|nr:protein kinase [Planctomycetota bacterium]